MDIIYRLQGVEFEWDQEKANSNIQKHGVSFEEAAEVFFDPFCQVGDASTAAAEDARLCYRIYFCPTTTANGIYGTPGTDAADFCSAGHPK